MNFTPDPKVQAVAEAYALDAADFLKGQYKVVLDWSDSSIRHIEAAMADMYRQLPAARPTEDEIDGFAKLYGYYVGEVFRKNHGATWGMIDAGDGPFTGLRADRSGRLFWPVGRARKRLTEGPAEDMWDYYMELRKEPKAGP